MMQENSCHIGRLEALRFIDGEMSSAEMTRVELHIHQCEECRHLMSEINDSSIQLKQLLAKTEQRLDQEEANHLLNARLSGAQQISSSLLGNRRHVLQLAAAGIVVVLALAGIGRWTGFRDLLHKSDIAMLPDKGLTPGAVRQVALQELCAVRNDDDLDPAVPSSIQKKVFYEYGVSTERQGKDFQVDYLINPQLGGTDDIHNLWPQPYHSTQWNADAKDALERHLHRMVCKGEVDLAEAQRDISTNWIVAYQKYFHTTKPV
jgi:hypothetical protein